MNKGSNYAYTNAQLSWLVVLRVLIGWFFLYEGLAKILSPNWTSYGYLMDSKGIFSPLFTMIAENPTMMAVADFINIYGLTIIGLLLILGLFERVGYLGAAILLLLYYLSHPPLINVEYLLPSEGTTLWVDKNLVMLVAVIVLYFFPTSKIIGLDRAFLKNRSRYVRK
jgi:thiosulfate dehydrogenase [quinone] large subunit